MSNEREKNSPASEKKNSHGALSLSGLRLKQLTGKNFWKFRLYSGATPGG
jgi:hypothetical protein